MTESSRHLGTGARGGQRRRWAHGPVQALSGRNGHSWSWSSRQQAFRGSLGIREKEECFKEDSAARHSVGGGEAAIMTRNERSLDQTVVVRNHAGFSIQGATANP